MVIQTQAKDLVVGTHGRSIFIADIKYISELNDATLSKDLRLLNDASRKLPRGLGKKGSVYTEPEKTIFKIPYYAKQAGVVNLKIMDAKGAVVKEITDTAEAGINFIPYDYTINKPATDKKTKSTPPAEDGNYYISKGMYKLKLTNEAGSSEAVLEFTEK
jgi:hypothetical protein